MLSVAFGILAIVFYAEQRTANGWIKHLEIQLEDCQTIRRALLERCQDVSKLRMRPEGTFTVTAYCSCKECCGTSKANRPKIHGKRRILTASGMLAHQGITVAVDTNVIPMHSKILIQGVGIRIAQDRGGAIKGKKIDLYFNDHDEAIEFGKQSRKVWLLEY